MRWIVPQERQGTSGEIVFGAYVVVFVLVKVQVLPESVRGEAKRKTVRLAR